MNVTWRRQTLRTKHPFATALWTTEEKQTLVVQIEHDGVYGCGEAVATTLYGQSNEQCEAVFADAARLIGDDPFRIDAIIKRLIAVHDGQRAAIDGLDAALHDWVGRRLGAPVWRVLGLEPPRKQSTFTIGIAERAAFRSKVDEALAAGYTALKIKVGVEQDDENLGYIRSKFDGPLFVDANAAWDPATAERRVRALAAYRPTVIEQPLQREHWAHFGALRKLGVAPIIADESCERPADVVRLNGLVDGINIKFNKCGGIREALRMVALGRAFGMKVMLGCFVCSSLAIAPALTIATLVDYADLDGALLLADDPYCGVSCDAGVLTLGDAPGFGVEPRSAAPAGGG